MSRSSSGIAGAPAPATGEDPGVGTLEIRVRVTTRAGRDEVAGERDGMLLVRVRAPPAEGAANEAAARVLARHFGVAPSSVELVRGARAREKLFRLQLR